MRTIRLAVASDLDAIKGLAVAAGLFSADEVAVFDEMFGAFLDGSKQGHTWLVENEDEEGKQKIVAAAYYAPEPFADRMWNLYFIAVDPEQQGAGSGARMVRYVERALFELGEEQARTLIVETSSTESFRATREFYGKQGFVEEARIRQFYGPDDHKVVFWKQIISAT